MARDTTAITESSAMPGLVIEINTTNIQKYSANQFKNLFRGENLLQFSFSEISLDSVLEI